MKIFQFMFTLTRSHHSNTVFAMQQQEAFIRSLIPRVCRDGISQCQGKLISEIMGNEKTHIHFVSLFVRFNCNKLFCIFFKK